mmetsp:Transcript_10225/g.33761  ORF Transcript_10225/g.33761 Transcript_10225/m.33761 type:complete len:785 (+) Transcript_10225:150-2504(+)
MDALLQEMSWWPPEEAPVGSSWSYVPGQGAGQGHPHLQRRQMGSPSSLYQQDDGDVAGSPPSSSLTPSSPPSPPSSPLGSGGATLAGMVASSQRRAHMTCAGRVKQQRLRSKEGQDIAVFIEMDDGGSDVFLSGRVSPRLPASGARIRFRLSLTKEERWVAQNGEWLYDGASVAAPVRRRDGARVEGVVSTRKPLSDCCWITIGDLDGGVYCLAKWCPGGATPVLGARVSFELKKGKYGDWRVASPPGLVVISDLEILPDEFHRVVGGGGGAHQQLLQAQGQGQGLGLGGGVQGQGQGLGLGGGVQGQGGLGLQGGQPLRQHSFRGHLRASLLALGHRPTITSSQQQQQQQSRLCDVLTADTPPGAWDRSYRRDVPEEAYEDDPRQRHHRAVNWGRDDDHDRHATTNDTTLRSSSSYGDVAAAQQQEYLLEQHRRAVLVQQQLEHQMIRRSRSDSVDVGHGASSSYGRSPPYHHRTDQAAAAASEKKLGPFPASASSSSPPLRAKSFPSELPPKPSSPPPPPGGVAVRPPPRPEPLRSTWPHFGLAVGPPEDEEKSIFGPPSTASSWDGGPGAWDGGLFSSSSVFAFDKDKDEPTQGAVTHAVSYDDDDDDAPLCRTSFDHQVSLADSDDDDHDQDDDDQDVDQDDDEATEVKSPEKKATTMRSDEETEPSPSPLPLPSPSKKKALPPPRKPSTPSSARRANAKIIAATTRAGVATRVDGGRLGCKFCAITFAASDGVSLTRHFLSRHAKDATPDAATRVKRALDDWTTAAHPADDAPETPPAQ